MNKGFFPLCPKLGEGILAELGMSQLEIAPTLGFNLAFPFLQSTMTHIKTQGRVELSKISYDWTISNLPKIGSIFIRSPVFEIGSHQLRLSMFVDNEASPTEIDIFVENQSLEDISLETLAISLIRTDETKFPIYQMYGVHFLPGQRVRDSNIPEGGFAFDESQSHFFPNGQIQIRFSAKLTSQRVLKSDSLRECQGRNSILVDLEREWNTGNYHDAKLVKSFIIPQMYFSKFSLIAYFN